MSISPARLAAFQALTKIEREKANSSEALASAEETLGEKDRSLCHELVLGSLRRQIFLDRIIDRYTAGKRLDLAVRIALRLGIYQLLSLDRVPDYSAINESVELVRRAKKSSATGFVNAILRRASREEVSFEFSDDVERISVETSHPRWLVERWVRQFGQSATLALATANNAAPMLAFRFTGKKSAGDREEVPDGCRPSPNVGGCYLSPRITRELLGLEAAGIIYFQDEASQMVAAAVNAPRTASVLDVCAAPGSKTGAIAERSSGLVVAGDISSPRTAVLQQNLMRQDVHNVAICQYDAERGLPFADAGFDVVLVDAPCSGTGTIRHNPEIRYRLSEDDFLKLPDKQLGIAINASKALRPGGCLIYSTCSIERDENEEVISRLLSAESGLSIVRPHVSEAFITDEGFARTFPHRDALDGFFIAEIHKLAIGQ